MKTIFSIIIFSLIISIVSCGNEDGLSACTYVPVSYVKGICGTAVLKIENASFFGLGEDVDGYQHVFLATLECFADQQALEGKSFRVELNPANFNDQCAKCLAAVDYSGSKKYNVRVHQDCEPKEK